MISQAEKEDKARIQREKIRKLESPVPFVLMLRNFIFGKVRPDFMTRLTFYANVAICLTFLIWSSFSYFAVISKDWIWEQKGIAVTTIIEQRGSELGFSEGVFMSRLEFASFASIVCWIIFFFGLVLLYRRKTLFTYFTLVPITIYLILNGLYLGFTYFIEDITLFDKLLLLISVVSLIIQAFLIRSGASDGAMNFFGVAQDEDDA